MSMSQEEIEALMSGADDTLFDEVEEETQEADEDSSPTTTDEPEEKGKSESDVTVDGVTAADTDTVDSETIDEMDVDKILAGIDGIVDDDEEKATASNTKSVDTEIENKINNNQYPLPVSDENKVVNQLNDVADDSEEKASKIFDVLSFILDENSEIAKYNKNMAEFILQQSELLESLSKKFPNVNVFAENLTSAQALIEDSKELAAKVDGENNKVFEAMELMQYHDINRQKIERVMAVIKKLSSYLNGIFEDDSDRAEVQIAKHISGDSNDIVNSDDIESLISEFSNQ
ncbi:MAG: hypothetical protein WA945_06335 [Arcobacteraceae bacterium]